MLHSGVKASQPARFELEFNMRRRMNMPSPSRSSKNAKPPPNTPVNRRSGAGPSSQEECISVTKKVSSIAVHE